jgi:hypothetical protein
MRRRVNARCKGLLEAESNHPNIILREVNYLHLTVRDFLEKNEIRAQLDAATKEFFNPNLRLCNSYIMRLKTAEVTDYDYFWDTLACSIEYAVRADPLCIEYQINLLKAIEKGFTGENSQEYRHSSPLDFAKTTSFLEFAVQCRLVVYVDATLRDMGKPKASLRASEALYLAIVCYNTAWLDRLSMRHTEPIYL